MKLEDLKRLCDEATPGPWADISNNRDIDAMVIWSTGPEDELKHYATYQECTNADAAFIAAARTYLPKLIAAAEAAKKFRNSDPAHVYSTEYYDAREELDDALAALEAE